MPRAPLMVLSSCADRSRATPPPSVLSTQGPSAIRPSREARTWAGPAVPRTTAQTTTPRAAREIRPTTGLLPRRPELGRGGGGSLPPHRLTRLHRTNSLGDRLEKEENHTRRRRVSPAGGTTGSSAASLRPYPRSATTASAAGRARRVSLGPGRGRSVLGRRTSSSRGAAPSSPDSDARSARRPGHRGGRVRRPPVGPLEGWPPTRG
jgi:hypothetical protein